MALTFDQAVEEEKRRNVLKGLPAAGFVPETKLRSTIEQPQQDVMVSKIPDIKRTEQTPPTQGQPLRVPTLKELSNAQREADLGKMNVSANNDTVTYSIGGNTLSYNERERQARTNLEKINEKIASGLTVSPSQMARINKLREQVGISRSNGVGNGAGNGIQRVGNMDVQFDSSVTPAARQAFLTDPVEPTAQMDRYDKRQLAQLQSSAATINDPKPIMPTNRTSDAIADYNKAMGEWSSRQIARQGLGVSKDENRIQEMDVTGMNKLRDIQGQVAQQPTDKENKPIVIDSYEPDPINPLGSIRKQRIVRQEPDGTFIDITPQQQSNTTVSELPDNHPAIKFLRDNPSQASNFKAKYGYLPAWAAGQ